jgi:hypothetical protein
MAIKDPLRQGKRTLNYDAFALEGIAAILIMAEIVSKRKKGEGGETEKVIN